MKYVIVLPDGAADVPLPQLGGRTPLEAARIPNMDRVAKTGRLGRLVTIPEGFTPGTDVGTLTVSATTRTSTTRGGRRSRRRRRGFRCGPTR